MIVSNVKLENFGGGEKHLVAIYTDIVIPAYAVGDDAIIGQIPAEIAVDVLSGFVASRPMVDYEILGNEDDGSDLEIAGGNIVASPRTIDGGTI